MSDLRSKAQALIVRARTEKELANDLARAAFPYDPAAWMEDGSCVRVDSELFFPGLGASTRDAKTVCAGCPVIAECLNYAIRHNERFGVWGGMSTNERDEIQRRRAS